MYTRTQKRFSPMKYTKSTKQRDRLYSPNRKTQASPLCTNKYYCHHSNSLYMGGADSFKKNGQGILLMDNGGCVISSHIHDNMINHNIVFRNKSITSMIIDYHQKDICFRYKQFLLQFMMINKDTQGKGFFIDYKSKKLYQLSFHHNILNKKIRIYDPEILQQIFNHNNLQIIIRQEHAQSLDMRLNLPNGMAMVKDLNQYVIGFCQKGGAQRNRIVVNGLAFSLRIDKDRPEDFNVIIKDRGFYQNSKLNQFGEKHFQNSNYYIGEFKDNNFHGKGILVYPKQSKWTYGYYEEGKLMQIISSSVSQNTKNSSPKKSQSPAKKAKQSIFSIIQKMHHSQRTYLQNKIVISPNHQYLLNLLNKVKSEDPYERESFNHIKQKQQQQSNLNKIQNDFVNKHYEFQTEEAIKKVMSKKGMNHQPNDQQVYPEEEIIVKSKTRGYQKHKQPDQIIDINQAVFAESRKEAQTKKINQKLKERLLSMEQTDNFNFFRTNSPQRNQQQSRSRIQTTQEFRRGPIPHATDYLVRKTSPQRFKTQQSSLFTDHKFRSKWRDYLLTRQAIESKNNFSPERRVNQTNFKYWDEDDQRDQVFYSRLNSLSPYSRHTSPIRR